MITSRVTFTLDAPSDSKNQLKKTKDSRMIQMNIEPLKDAPPLQVEPDNVKDISIDKISWSSSSSESSDNEHIDNAKITFSKHKKIKALSKSYGLERNLLTRPSSPSDLSHLYLPIYHKDDENYKAKLYGYLKKQNRYSYQTDCGKNALYKKYPLEINEQLNKDTFVRKKAVFSCRKQYNSEHGFLDSKNKRNYFRFYYDSDIGFDSRWQAPIHEAQMDDDVASDDEQISYAKRHCLKHLNEAIKNYVRNPANARNYRKYHQVFLSSV